MYILCIETATPICSVALLKDGKLAGLNESDRKNSHAEVITVFIRDLMDSHQLDVSDLESVAVSKGPGSYTGLRIGVSTAKGLCYAGDKPLIAVNTLQSMAAGAIRKTAGTDKTSLWCPMIDARRMEVYSALFDHNGEEIRETKAEIIDEHSFADLLKDHVLYFFGDGAEKCRSVISHPNARFLDDFRPSAAHMAPLVEQKLAARQFEDVAYFEPYYLKDFVAGVPKVKGLR
jgi:tRNA threonylcarbamoyladenosine biosynthesis protein TsaB